MKLVWNGKKEKETGQLMQLIFLPFVIKIHITDQITSSLLGKWAEFLEYFASIEALSAI